MLSAAEVTRFAYHNVTCIHDLPILVLQLCLQRGELAIPRRSSKDQQNVCVRQPK